MKFIHELSDVKAEIIGDSTKIWQFCVILPNAQIGSNCNICSHVFIENDVRIGDNVTIKYGVHICDGVTIEDSVFVGPGVMFTNDKNPKSRNRANAKIESTLIKKGASIGANSTILPGVTIGENAMIGAGSIITKDVPANATVIGTNKILNR